MDVLIEKKYFKNNQIKGNKDNCHALLSIDEMPV